MIRNLFVFIVLLATTFCSAQTKIIAHKSHSGSSNIFSNLLKANDNALKTSNYGMAPQVEVKNAQLDSLIFINDTTQIMVTKEFCSNLYGEDAIVEEWNPQTQKRVKAKKVSEDGKTSLWKAGRDTVYNHSLFSQNEGLTYIKTILKRQYNFINPTDSVVFIGYSDNPNLNTLENSSIYVDTENIEKDVVQVTLTGRYLSDGSCAPSIIYGLDRKDENGNWEKVFDVDEVLIRKCGLPYVQYKKQKEQLVISHLAVMRSKYNLKTKKGTYRLYGRLHGTKSIVYSNEFKIK